MSFTELHGHYTRSSLNILCSIDPLDTSERIYAYKYNRLIMLAKNKQTFYTIWTFLLSQNKSLFVNQFTKYTNIVKCYNIINQVLEILECICP